ncbi:MAG: hypothetical protein C5B58_15120 [Acidobacteria bacterium]|nr:MAG: hypothetical protein C5B58_15120 [Acidobacteriota bacterium]
MTFLPWLASAKRAEPPKVEPVIHDDIRYVAPNDDGRRGYIEAWDVQTNRKLWDLTVFTNRIDPKLEQDVQWVFIDRLSVRDGTLIVKSERGTTYRIDLKTKAITESEAAWSTAPAVTAHPHEIPEVIDRAIASGSLAKKYELSYHINPFYLRGDFDGDGKIDVAAMVKQRSTGKLGIAIINGATEKITILGAGTSIGNGGDDFEWMDSWEFRSKDRATNETKVANLRADALLVSKSESVSALIYWNGKRYAWLQQGD